MSSGIADDSPAWLSRLQDDSNASTDPKVWAEVRKYLLLTVERNLGGGMRHKVDASDVVQQSLLEAYNHLESFQGTTTAELRAWLTQLARHNLSDAARRFRTLRRDVTREEPLETADEQALASPRCSASSIVRRKELDDELWNAVSQLPYRTRQLLELRHRQALSYAEIGERMQISEAAARKLWSRTIGELRQALGKKR